MAKQPGGKQPLETDMDAPETLDMNGCQNVVCYPASNADVDSDNSDAISGKLLPVLDSFSQTVKDTVQKVDAMSQKLTELEDRIESSGKDNEVSITVGINRLRSEVFKALLQDRCAVRARFAGLEKPKHSGELSQQIQQITHSLDAGAAPKPTNFSGETSQQQITHSLDAGAARLGSIPENGNNDECDEVQDQVLMLGTDISDAMKKQVWALQECQFAWTDMHEHVVSMDERLINLERQCTATVAKITEITERQETQFARICEGHEMSLKAIKTILLERQDEQYNIEDALQRIASLEKSRQKPGSQMQMHEDVLLHEHTRESHSNLTSHTVAAERLRSRTPDGSCRKIAATSSGSFTVPCPGSSTFMPNNSTATEQSSQPHNSRDLSQSVSTGITRTLSFVSSGQGTASPSRPSPVAVQGRPIVQGTSSPPRPSPVAMQGRPIAHICNAAETASGQGTSSPPRPSPVALQGRSIAHLCNAAETASGQGTSSPPRPSPVALQGRSLVHLCNAAEIASGQGTSSPPRPSPVAMQGRSKVHHAMPQRQSSTIRVPSPPSQASTKSHHLLCPPQPASAYRPDMDTSLHIGLTNRPSLAASS